MAVPAVLWGVAPRALSLSRADYMPPGRARGDARVSVRSYGALGNGSSDDTAAFQAAINALPSTGGTVYVPAGTYMIDAVKSVRLRSRMHLELDNGAVLKAIPNGAEKAYVVLADKVSDVEISGGQIIGERYGHLVTTGEWGHAIFIRGSKRVTIRDIRVADCYGDGISLGAAPVWQSDPIYSEDVVIANVCSTNNRRQALTIGRAKYVEVRDSEFSGSNGVKPETGIDIEPDLPDEGGISFKVTIENCVIRHNKTYGINVFKGARDITIRNCRIEENGSCGLVTVGCSTLRIEGNTIRNNSATGLLLSDGTEACRVESNTFYGNYSRLGEQVRTPFTLSGWAPKIERDILMRGTLVDVSILSNYYR
ncbi:MAG: right-handed parallel beta-helix repeat-containing protein [Pseudomonadota bacterium]